MAAGIIPVLGITWLIVFAVKGLILTECLTRAARSWGIFNGIREALKAKSGFLRRLLDCFECTSVWVGFFVFFYLFLFDFPPITFGLIFATLARYLHVFYEWLDAARAVKEGQIGR